VRWLGAGLLSVVLVFCQSCKRQSTGDYLEGRSEELVRLTMPGNASNVTRSAVKHAAWAESCFREFDVPLEASAYTAWVTRGLAAEFKQGKGADASLVFERDLATDTERVSIRLSPGRDKLHVRVDANVTAD
jgi:hypothetical protein